MAIVETDRKVVQPRPSSCVPVGHLEVFSSQWQEVIRFIVTLQGSSADRLHNGDNPSVYVSRLVMDYQDKRANRASPWFRVTISTTPRWTPATIHQPSDRTVRLYDTDENQMTRRVRGRVFPCVWSKATLPTAISSMYAKTAAPMTMTMTMT